MIEPKLLRILMAISTRLADVRMANGYYTDAGQQVVRGRYSLDHTVLPGMAVWMESNDPSQSLQQRARADGVLVVEATAAYNNEEPEDMACYLAADINKALETDDRTLGGLLISDKDGQGVTWQGDEIIYPENENNLVGVRVSYAVPHIRRAGDPTN